MTKAPVLPSKAVFLSIPRQHDPPQKTGLPLKRLIHLVDCTDEETQFFPMRLHKDRSVYHTTNTKGEVVEIPNPGTQFKTQFRKSENNNPSKPLVELSETAFHPTKPYRKIPRAGGKDIPDHLWTCCQQLYSCPNDDKLKDSDVGVFIHRHFNRMRNPKHTSVYYKIPKQSKYKELRLERNQTVSQAYSLQEWPRVKLIIMDIIRGFGLECLLEDTREGYESAFPMEDGRSDYENCDTIVSYTIMSCVRWRLFYYQNCEYEFYKGVHFSHQRTKYVLDYIDKIYFGLLRAQVNSRYITRSDARRIKLRRKVPDLLHQRKKDVHHQDQVIHRYTRGLEPFFRVEDKKRIACPWYVSAAESLVAEFPERFKRYISTKAEMERLEKNGLANTPRHRRLYLHSETFCGGNCYSPYCSSRDFVYKVSRHRAKERKVDPKALRERFSTYTANTVRGG